MTKIPTANDFLMNNSSTPNEDMLIKFTKLHMDGLLNYIMSEITPIEITETNIDRMIKLYSKKNIK
jgi:hypothetical protein